MHKAAITPLNELQLTQIKQIPSWVEGTIVLNFVGNIVAQEGAKQKRQWRLPFTAQDKSDQQINGTCFRHHAWWGFETGRPHVFKHAKVTHHDTYGRQVSLWRTAFMHTCTGDFAEFAVP